MNLLMNINTVTGTSTTHMEWLILQLDGAQTIDPAEYDTTDK